MVDSVSASSLATQSISNKNSANKLSQDFDQFLTLLTTQLQNQDPLSPMDSTEFTNQLVAFSGVEQQIRTNESLDTIAGLQLALANTSALGYVGLDAQYLGDTFTFGGDPVSLRYSLASNADKVDVNILDKDGNIVRNLDNSGISAGAHDIVWDGLDDNGFPLAEGNYTFAVGAVDNKGAAINSQVSVTARITGVQTVDGVVELIAGEIALPISAVISANTPPKAQTTTDTTGTGS